MSEGFFSRWSRRKQAVATGQTPAEPVAPDTEASASLPPAAVPSLAPVEPVAPDAGQSPREAALPTLEDTQALTPQSDFQPFMRQGVGADVRNAAMKKLFADPHFNVMDGLDIYIDDYSQPDPMPAGMLRRMASAQFLKLVPPEADTPAPPEGKQVVAQSPDSSAAAEPEPHDHPDLQLQPNPAPADPEPGSRPG